MKSKGRKFEKERSEDGFRPRKGDHKKRPFQKQPRFARYESDDILDDGDDFEPDEEDEEY